jgi:hypothetical protein
VLRRVRFHRSRALAAFGSFALVAQKIKKKARQLLAVALF